MSVIHLSFLVFSHSDRYMMDSVLKLKAKEREALLSVLIRQDTLVVLPTGFGRR